MNEIRRKRPSALEDGALLALPALSSSAQDDDAGTFDDELSALRSSMTELSDEDRKLLAARYETGTPVAVIAQSRGMSVEYVKLKLFRLRKQLAAKIKRKVAQHG